MIRRVLFIVAFGALAFAAAVALAAWPPLATGAPGDLAAHAYPRLFGTTELRSTDLRPFPRWTAMLARHLAEEQAGDVACSPTPDDRCAVQEWRAFLETQREEAPREQLEAVNAFVNRHRYVLDKANYGIEDYWATPREFAKNDGDCEDFAIAKYLSLKALGWNDADLRIVVLLDTERMAPNAIAVAYGEGEAWVLDNQITEVTSSAAVARYRPYYSLNESGWWLHRP
jgi:predicted transglutaminase-like cysteine proteinase